VETQRTQIKKNARICINLKISTIDVRCMVIGLVRSLEEDEEIIGLEVSYLNSIKALVYLASCTRPNIAFAFNLLVRYSFIPTKRHWNEVKHILRYLRETIKINLFYSGLNSQLIGYEDAGYLSDPSEERLQTSYLFT
jgi:hypothetical protein